MGGETAVQGNNRGFERPFVKDESFLCLTYNGQICLWRTCMAFTIPFVDFGGQPDGPLLHFAHSNGYPPRCFRQMLEPLLPHYRVWGMYHRPLWQNGDLPESVTSWQVVADDLLAFFDQEGVSEVIGVGHSLGAVATMLAAVQRPLLFRALVLIEPVFLSPQILELVRQFPEQAKQMPMVLNALRRRNQWPSRQAAFDLFRTKEVFGRWSDDALWDFVQYGLVENEQGEVSLLYTREWEAQFYGLPPTMVWDEIPSVIAPTLAVRGVKSDTLTPESWAFWQSLQTQATFIEMADAGHMVTMERPLALAEHIITFLAHLESKKKQS